MKEVGFLPRLLPTSGRRDPLRDLGGPDDVGDGCGVLSTSLAMEWGLPICPESTSSVGDDGRGRSMGLPGPDHDPFPSRVPLGTTKSGESFIRVWRHELLVCAVTGLPSSGSTHRSLENGSDSVIQRSTFSWPVPWSTGPMVRVGTATTGYTETLSAYWRTSESQT